MVQLRHVWEVVKRCGRLILASGLIGNEISGKFELTQLSFSIRING
ncbi:hypothetical protein KCTCHS21_37170 [Cohnella abietis]|uniref:Uncharacterized protein n=1 Tax=Cohnella abietis TaxID=2507935 RepID=A0A3T1D8I3_9BACL|nr:hypothetical protein KCTCHS21_37170 [Cohnella abietis]